MTQTHPSLLADETVTACAGRLDRLRRELAAQEIDGLLVTGEKDILYLTGFVGHDSVLLVESDRACILSDPRYDEYLEPWRETGQFEIVMGVRHRLERSVAELRRRDGLRRLGFQAEQVTVAGHETLASAVEGEHLVATKGIVGTLRMRKDEHEVRRIEQANHWHQDALIAALAALAEGMTEQQFAARLIFEMSRRGAAGASFDPIIGSGANSSVIHHQTGASVIEPGVLLVDWGAVTPDGYCSDMTRTFGVGAMPGPISDVYPIVLEAQLAAIDACRPGRTCAEIDAVARRVITDAGHGDHFGHGLGHGLGLDVHEAPYFNDLQTDVVLEPGMVMTVEPGIYLPGVGGVRIEDDVVITEAGVRVLGSWPKDLDSTIVEFCPAPAAV